MYIRHWRLAGPDAWKKFFAEKKRRDYRRVYILSLRSSYPAIVLPLLSRPILVHVHRDLLADTQVETAYCREFCPYCDHYYVVLGLVKVGCIASSTVVLRFLPMSASLLFMPMPLATYQRAVIAIAQC